MLWTDTVAVMGAVFRIGVPIWLILGTTRAVNLRFAFSVRVLIVLARLEYLKFPDLTADSSTGLPVEGGGSPTGGDAGGVSSSGCT
jgi:hypothetical protein